MSDFERLNDMRKSIDNIDNAIISMFAERFKITAQIGYYKAVNCLPIKDAQREALQIERICKLADEYGLDPEFAKEILEMVLNRVVQHHEIIAKEYLSTNS